MAWQRSAFTENELMSGDVTVTEGQYNRIGEYQVKAGEMWAFGYGSQTGQDNAQGRIYIDLQNATPAAIDGYVKLVIYGPQDNFLEEIDYFRTESLRSSTDRTKQLSFALREPGITEDKKLVIEFKPDASGTVSKANTAIQIDMSRQLVR